MSKYSENVAAQLSYLQNYRDRKRKPEDKAQLIASRITRGWAFLGVTTAEQHKKDVEEIKEEVYRQLRKPLSQDVL